MKLDKSTKVLLNLVLILTMALLLKFLVAVPKELYSQQGKKHMYIRTETRGSESSKIMDQMGGAENWNKFCNELAKSLNKEFVNPEEAVINYYGNKGWRLHTVLENFQYIFER